jgi:hypothetical protein
MPVLNRWRATRILIVAAASVPLLLAGGAGLISVLVGQSCSGGTGFADSPSQVAQRNIPASVLAIYESVGARYHIPWEVLAGIGEEECDHGRNPDPSCTPQPGATGPGVANCAGASGPMQVGVGSGPWGSAGDEYDQLRQFLPDPSLGPHDPTTAVELAALVLIKDKGAPTGQAIDAYPPYVAAYNGSGPMAAAYAARVIADAHTYQGTSMVAFAGCAAAGAGAYVNPFAGEAWGPSRNDQGVDYDPLKVEPIRAIGAGTIVEIGSWGSYGPWFDYKLAGGEFAGKCIYVAEHIGSILPPGTSFNAGDTLPRHTRDRTGRSGAGPRRSTRRRSPGRSAAVPSRTTSTRAGARLRASCAAWGRRRSRIRGRGRCTPAGRVDAPTRSAIDHDR